MKRSSIIFAITLIASLTTSLLVYKYYRLTLTLPPIISGSALLLSRRRVKNEVLRLLSLNLGIFLCLAGGIFSGLNLISLASSSDEKVSIKEEGDYGTTRRMLTGNDAMGLGYAYPPNLRNYSSKKVAYTSPSQKEVVYDVIYNTDQLSNRYTPNDSKDRLNKSDSILFLGDSLTFGEGLNDNETLSYFIQTLTGRSTLNAGLHGYGAHQALRILEDDDLFKKRTKGHKVTTILYRSIVDHINRTAGYSSWDRIGPCYELKGKNSVSYQGSFAECRKTNNNLITRFANRLASSSEPFTKKVFERFTTSTKYRSNKYLRKDVDTFVAVVSEMKAVAESKGINLIVLLEDAGTYNELCGQKVPFARELEDKLENQHLNLILTSKVYTDLVCTFNELTISKYDRHPSMIANKILAEYLIKNNLIK